MDAIKNDYSAAREFLDKVANSAILFQDPFTESTRKQQGTLLITSLTSILLSLAVVSASEWAPSGAKLIIQKPELFVQIVGLVCVYLLVVYVINAYQDIRSYQYRILPAQAEMHITAIENLEIVLDNRAKAEPILLKISKLGDRRRELAAEWKILINDYETNCDKVDKEMSEFTNQMREDGHSLLDIHEMQKYLELKEEKRRLSEQKEIDEKPYRETILGESNNDWDGMLQLEAELNALTKFDEINSQFKVIKKISQEYIWLNKIRTFIEIIFPVGVAIYAIWLALFENLI